MRPALKPVNGQVLMFELISPRWLEAFSIDKGNSQLAGSEVTKEQLREDDDHALELLHDYFAGVPRA